MTLDRYLARRFAVSFIGVFAVFFLFMGFLDLIEEIGRFSDTPARFTDLIQLTLLRVPEAIYRILPLIMVLATIALFLALARSSEMVVTRASGRSALRSLMAPVTVSLLIGVLSVAVFNPIVASTAKEYEARASALKGRAPVLALSGDGLWLRQGDGDSQTVIRAAAASLEGTVLEGVTFIVFGPESGPVRRLEASRAELTEGAWELRDVKSWPLTSSNNPEAEATTTEQLTVPSSLTRDQIRDSFGTPASIPIWELPAFVAQLEAAGFSARRHEVWLHMELALPVFLVSLLLVSAGLTMRHQRGGRTGIWVLAAVMLGFGLFFLRNLSQILGESGQIPPILAAWAPPVAALCLALGLLLHLEDG